MVKNYQPKRTNKNQKNSIKHEQIEESSNNQNKISKKKKF